MAARAVGCQPRNPSFQSNDIRNKAMRTTCCRLVSQPARRPPDNSSASGVWHRVERDAGEQVDVDEERPQREVGDELPDLRRVQP
jgi:hypothetical protein